MPLPYDRPATLGDLIRETDTFRVACRRCGRDERYNVAEAFAFHGPDERVWTVVQASASDCWRLGERQIYEMCQVACPTLSEFAPGQRDRS